nr:hypothetical protein CPGR_00770 [Mycolicibacterium malmesburyense]
MRMLKRILLWLAFVLVVIFIQWSIFSVVLVVVVQDDYWILRALRRVFSVLLGVFFALAVWRQLGSSSTQENPEG